MKLFAIYNDSHKQLKNIFLESLCDDWDLYIKYFEISSCDFQSSDFMQLTFKKAEITLDMIRRNKDSIILVSDLDIQFFGECNQVIVDSMRNKDIVFMAGNNPDNWKEGDSVNIGFMAIRCNDKTKDLYTRLLMADWKVFDGDQAVMNKILANKEVGGLRYGVFPKQFWFPRYSKLPPEDILLHHAIQITEKGKSDKDARLKLKLKQLEEIKTYVANL